MSEESNEKKNTNNGSKLYEYMRDHPSVLIASISAIIAVISFAVNAVIYLRQYQYLRFWGFDLAQCEYTGTNQIYVFAISVFMFAAVSIVQRYNNKTIRVYYNRTTKITVLRKISREFKRRSRKSNRKLRVVKRHMKQFWSSSEGTMESSIKNEIIGIDQQVKETHERIRKFKKDYHHVKWHTLCILFLVLIPSFIITFFIMLLFLAARNSANYSFGVCLLVSLVFSMLNILVSWLTTYWMTNSELKAILRKYGNDLEKLNELYNEQMKSEVKDEYPIKVWPSYRIKDVFSDANIKQEFMSFILYCALLMLFTSFSAIQSQTKQTEFQIYDDGDSSYAIIYQSKDKLYLDKVVIQDNTIVIDTTSHRTITTDDVSYQDIKFEAVSIIRKEQQ